MTSAEPREVFRAATADMMSEPAEVMPPSPFSGTPFSDLASGKADLGSLLPDPSTSLSTRSPGSDRRPAGPADDEWDEGGV